MTTWTEQTISDTAWSERSPLTWARYNAALDDYNGTQLASDDVNLTYNGGLIIEENPWTESSNTSTAWSQQ